MNKGELIYFHATKSKYRVIIGMLFLFSIFFTTTALSTSLNEEEQEVVLSQAELAQSLAPIALYPDTLLTHILIASTYPIEVIEAERWLKKHSTLTIAQVQTKAEHKAWDPSIQALLAFPQVMAKLSGDLTWMQKLGDAFLQDESRVLGSIQTLRQQAEQAGSLATMDNVEVIKEQNIIIIESAQPEIIYVPYYDTRLVYGRWYWTHYPPVYWHSPAYYTANHGDFYWGNGVHISSHFYFSTFHWHNRHVVVSPYNYANRHGYHSRKRIVTSHHAKRWNHQPRHRRGVAYSNGRLKQKYYRGIVHSNPNVHRNHNRVVGSNDKVKSYKSTKQINRHKNFNAQLKVKSPQQSKPYRNPRSDKVNKSSHNRYAVNKSIKDKNNYRQRSQKSASTAKLANSKTTMTKRNRPRVHQPTKHYVSSKRQPVKKSSVQRSSKHKSTQRIK